MRADSGRFFLVDICWATAVGPKQIRRVLHLQPDAIDRTVAAAEEWQPKGDNPRGCVAGSWAVLAGRVGKITNRPRAGTARLLWADTGSRSACVSVHSLRAASKEEAAAARRQLLSLPVEAPDGDCDAAEAWQHATAKIKPRCWAVATGGHVGRLTRVPAPAPAAEYARLARLRTAELEHYEATGVWPSPKQPLDDPEEYAEPPPPPGPLELTIALEYTASVVDGGGKVGSGMLELAGVRAATPAEAGAAAAKAGQKVDPAAAAAAAEAATAAAAAAHPDAIRRAVLGLPADATEMVCVDAEERAKAVARRTLLGLPAGAVR